MPLTTRVPAKLTSAIAIALGISIALLSHRAVAQEVKLVCIEEHEKGQSLRREERWQVAMETFLSCSRAECPQVIRDECGTWFTDLQQRLPSVVVQAVDDQGGELPGAKLTVDGGDARISATAVPMDPGEHRFRIELNGAGIQRYERTETESVVNLREGEHGRVVRLVLPVRRATVALAHDSAHASTTAPPAIERRINLPAWIVLGVAGAGAVTFGGFALGGRSLESDRASGCAPSCSDDAVSPVRRAYFVADVALGVALVSGAVAAILFLTNSESSTAKVRGR
jgi:hypothetical protein